jgi:DNA-binding NtrC family response regulator
VLIEGEPGTGKELCAEALHAQSSRRDGPFVVVDCRAISPPSMEIELFGQAGKGEVHGFYEEAQGGTLFIDEVTELDATIQARLLRAVERSEVRRAGASKWMRADVRLICATRRDIDGEVQARRFREDLLTAFAVGRVELPALRKRQGDIALLARFFWVQMGGDQAALPPDILQRFEAHDWPGNVRELYNAVAQQLAIGQIAFPKSNLPRSAEVDPGDFIDRAVTAGRSLPVTRQLCIDEVERRYIRHVVAVHGGNVARAAAASGIGLRYFQMLRAKR